MKHDTPNLPNTGRFRHILGKPSAFDLSPNTALFISATDVTRFKRSICFKRAGARRVSRAFLRPFSSCHPCIWQVPEHIYGCRDRLHCAALCFREIVRQVLHLALQERTPQSLVAQCRARQPGPAPIEPQHRIGWPADSKQQDAGDLLPLACWSSALLHNRVVNDSSCPNPFP